MEGFYARHILPRLINCACSQESIQSQRARVVPAACGRVLELGLGSGLNLPYYRNGQVERLEAIEPSEALRGLAVEATGRHPGLAVTVTPARAEALPYDDGSFDTIVCTFTLCSVADPAAALREARRVLRPGGRFLFCEHGRAADAGVARWQARIEPVWKRLFGGCHLTRPVAAAIVSAGFSLVSHEQGYLAGSPRFVGWTEWGSAERA